MRKEAGNNKIIVLVVLITLITALAGCSKKSEYFIQVPEDSKFNYDSVKDLTEADGELIKEFIPKVTKWYDSIDISEPQSIDFITDDIEDMGSELADNEIYQYCLEIFMAGQDLSEEEYNQFEQISTVNAIYGQMSAIMMTDEFTFELNSDKKATHIIKEDSWIKLGDKIKEAIEYYYK